MLQAAVCLGFLMVGQVGWRPLPEGGIEYIIQINPELLALLQQGDAFCSDVPPELHDVRSYRIVCGSAPVPREYPGGTAAFRATPESGSQRTWGPQNDAFSETSLRGDPSARPESAAAGVSPPPSGRVADPFLLARPPDEEAQNADLSQAGAYGSATAPSTAPQPPTPESFWPTAAANGRTVGAPPPDRGNEPPILGQSASGAAADEPKRLPSGTGGQPLSAQWATFMTGTSEPGAATPTASSELSDSTATPPEAAKPWWALTLALAVTFTSVGGSCYLGWIAWEYRRRYRAAMLELTQLKVDLPDEAGPSDSGVAV